MRFNLHAASRAATPPAPRWKRRCSRPLLLLAVAMILVIGCGSETRQPVDAATLLQRRCAEDDQALADGRQMISRVVARAKRLQDQYSAGQRSAKPVINVLVISGGGDWGAFGAGFLKGWSSVPKDDPLALPTFDIVTGVSTGSLIAPFAFLGDQASLDSVCNLYRNPKPDWIKKRGTFYFLPKNASFADISGLERDLRLHVTARMLRRIVEAGDEGRVLAVNTTDIDDGSAHVFDLAEEARRALDFGKPDRVYDVVLASCAIPGLFPFRMIDGDMHVDGGITGNIIYGGRIPEEDGMSAMWTRQYPGVTPPKVRYWVLFNNQLRPQPQVTEPRWTAVVTRSLETGTRASTVTAIRHLHAMAEIARLKHQGDVEVRVATIPDEWKPPKPGAFVKETMNSLADVGQRMGADPSSWRETPP